MSTYLVTGSSRGIGFELVKQLSHRSTSEVSTIVATSRSKPSAQLKDLVDSSGGRVLFIPLDAVDQESVGQAAEKVEAALQSQGLDVLINNVGIGTWLKGGIESMPGSDLDNIFHNNVTSAHMVSSAFLPLLRKGSRKLIANVSSTLGSMSWAPSFLSIRVPSYKISKAAMNMLTVQWALELEDEGFTVISFSPGHLKTDAAGDKADLPVDVGVKATLNIVDEAERSSNGKFFNIHIPGEWEWRYPGGVTSW